MINGEVTAERLEDKLFQRQIMQEVLIASTGYGSLNNDAVIKRAQVGGRTKVSVTTMDAITVSVDLDELVGSDIKSPEFGSITADLKADEVKIAFTDEALSNSTLVNPMDLSVSNAAVGFARALDRKIAAALDTTPQMGTPINLKGKTFMEAAAEAAGKLGEYQMTAVVGGQSAVGRLMGNIAHMSDGMQGISVREGKTYLAGYDVPIITSSSLEMQAPGYVYFVSNDVPAAYVFEGSYKTRVYDDPKHRATVWQGDVWNTVISNIRQVANTNQGVVKTQLTYS